MPNSYTANQKLIRKKHTQFVNKVILKITDLNKQIDTIVKSIITTTYEKYGLPKMLDGKPDAASTTAFMNEKVKYGNYGRISRTNALKLEIRDSIAPIMLRRDKLIEAMARIAYLNGYYWNAYATTNAVKRNVKWPKVKDKQIDKAINENPLSVFKTKEL